MHQCHPVPVCLFPSSPNPGPNWPGLGSSPAHAPYGLATIGSQFPSTCLLMQAQGQPRPPGCAWPPPGLEVAWRLHRHRALYPAASAVRQTKHVGTGLRLSLPPGCLLQLTQAFLAPPLCRSMREGRLCLLPPPALLLSHSLPQRFAQCALAWALSAPPSLPRPLSASRVGTLAGVSSGPPSPTRAASRPLYGGSTSAKASVCHLPRGLAAAGR